MTFADPFNCPKCGAHDYGLYAAGMVGCPHCKDAENARLRAALETAEKEKADILERSRHAIETMRKERDEARADADRLRDRVESLRGLCKSAVGALCDADAPKVASEIAELIGDMEPAAREVHKESTTGSDDRGCG